MNFANTSLDSFEDDNFFIIIGTVSASAIGIPTLTFSAVILPSLITDRQGNQSINTVLLSLIVVAIFTVLTSILFDISLITGSPTFGRCTLVENTVTTCIVSSLSMMSLLLVMLLSIVFYYSVWSSQRSHCSVYLAIISIVAFAIAQSIVFGGLLFVTPRKITTIRGSFCAIKSDHSVISNVSLAVNILLLVISFIVTVIFTFLTCCKVHVFTDHVVKLDKQVVRSMLIFLISMLVTTGLTKAPILVVQIIEDMEHHVNILWSLIGIAVLQLRVPIVMSLTLMLHKRVGKRFVETVVMIFQCVCTSKPVCHTINR